MHAYVKQNETHVDFMWRYFESSEKAIKIFLRDCKLIYVTVKKYILL